MAGNVGGIGVPSAPGEPRRCPCIPHIPEENNRIAMTTKPLRGARIKMQENLNYKLKQVGIIKTPYQDDAPYQPIDVDDGEFCIVVNDQYVDGLNDLAKFRYIYVMYYAHRITREAEMIVSPPWAEGKRVGVFSSRSPLRPNPIGLSVVRVKSIVENRIYTSGLDVFDGTPLLDIKPYIKDLDSKTDANYGWVEEMDDMEHLILHIKGIPHNY